MIYYSHIGKLSIDLKLKRIIVNYIESCMVKLSMKFSLLKENRLRSYHVIHNVEAESSVTLNLLVARTFLYFLFFNFPGGGASHSISPTIC